MWVAARSLERANWPRLGRAIGIIFCIAMVASTATGGNMFQAWNIGEITQTYFGVPTWLSGIVIVIIVGVVIIGGIKRIGKFTGTIVPLMVLAYLGAGTWVLIENVGEIPEMLALIVQSAFSPAAATGAFIGGTVFFGFQIGMKRAIFSNEAGQGSSPMVHAAVKTDEPVREGIVAGLEPFIDTIVVCTFTALIIMSTGIWNRAPDLPFDEPPVFTQAEYGWVLPKTPVPESEWFAGDSAFVIVSAHDNRSSGNNLHKITGVATATESGLEVIWAPFASSDVPTMVSEGWYRNYVGATLTAKAFDTVLPGVGKWVIVLASWLFGISTMIAWSYYGEQGIVFIGRGRGVIVYKVIYLGLIVLATQGLVKSDADLDNVIGIGTGIIMFANIPIIWMFGYQAIRAYKDYIARLKAGKIGPDHPPPHLDDLLSGRDVER
jgi:AGCS family alanine or glycine:cation symporter